MAKLYKEAIDLLSEISQNRNYIYGEEIDEIENLLNDDSYKIAVIGEFSVGKSTFLNSIIGKRILYSSAQEATGVLTIIKNSEKMVADIIYDNNSTDTIDLSKENSYLELKSYLDKNRNDNKAIRSVNINYPMMGIDKEVILMDTPGLQGIRDKELCITRDALKEANATIVLINYKGLTGTELNLLQGKLKEFGRIKTKEIILVINKIGELHDNISNEEALIKINRVIESVKNTLMENKLEHVKVFALDSRDYLWGKDITLFNEVIKENDYNINKLLTQEEYLKRSSFNQFDEYLHNFLNKDNRTKAFYEDIREKILILMGAFKEELQNNKTESVKDIDISLNKIKIQKDLITENRRAITNATIRQLNESVVEFSSAIYSDIKNDIETSKNDVLIYIDNNIKSYENLNNEFKKKLGIRVESLLNKSTETNKEKINKYKANINLFLNDTFNKEFKKLFSNNNKNIEFIINESEVKISLDYKGHVDDDFIKILENDIKENEEELNNNNQLLKFYSGDYSKDIQQLEAKVRVNKIEKENEISRLGNKPSPVQKYITVTRTRTKWIFFTEDYDVILPNGLDYSNGSIWDKKCDDLRTVYGKKEKNYQEDIDKLNGKKNEKEKIKEKIISLEKHIKDLKEQKRIAIEKRKKFIEREEKMFTEMKKNELHGVFSGVLVKYYGEISKKLKTIMDEFYKYIKDEVSKQIDEHLKSFEVSLDEKYNQTIKNIEGLKVDEDDILKKLNVIEKSISRGD